MTSSVVFVNVGNGTDGYLLHISLFNVVCIARNFTVKIIFSVKFSVKFRSELYRHTFSELSQHT